MVGHCIYREENNDTQLGIWEDDDRRSLWFDDVILQSEINIYDPAVLPNPVNRAMLAHLMFGLRLQRVLLAGCGGGVPLHAGCMRGHRGYTERRSRYRIQLRAWHASISIFRRQTAVGS